MFTVTDSIPVCFLERIGDRARSIDRQPVFPVVAVFRNDVPSDLLEADLAIRIGLSSR